jgi:hypothetical protein
MSKVKKTKSKTKLPWYSKTVAEHTQKRILDRVSTLCPCGSCLSARRDGYKNVA